MKNDVFPFWLVTLLLAATSSCHSPFTQVESAEVGDSTSEVSHPSWEEEQEDATRGIFNTHFPCPDKVQIDAPYAILDDGWGLKEVRANLDALDDESVAAPVEGVSPQSSFAFRSARYRVDGVRSWIKAQTEGDLRGIAKSAPPGDELPLGFQSWVTLTFTVGQTWPDGYYYLSEDGQIAMYCSPRRYPGGSFIPNPTCWADIEDDAGNFLFGANFPIRISARVNEIVTAGERLFEDSVAACADAGKSGIGHIERKSAKEARTRRS